MTEEENTKRKRTLPKHLQDYVDVPGQTTAANSKQTESTSIRSGGSHRTSEKSGGTSKSKSSSAKERAKEAAREARLAKLKVEQLKEKALLEVQIATQKAELDAQLTIKEAEQEADWKEQEALLLEEEASEDEISERMDEFEQNEPTADDVKNVKVEQCDTKKGDLPSKDVKFATKKVTEWLKTVTPKQEPDEFNERARVLEPTEEKEKFANWANTALGKSPLMSSLPKIQLPVFDGDPCHWPNWYGMFKVLVDDQMLSKTQKMIYLKASVKGSAEKAISGMLFDGTMYEQAVEELTLRFGNPELISRSLIRKLLELPTLKDEDVSSLRSFVDNMHNIVRTLKSYGHSADVQAAANMQQVMDKLPPKIAERWSRRKRGLQPKS